MTKREREGEGGREREREERERETFYRESVFVEVEKLSLPQR